MTIPSVLASSDVKSAAAAATIIRAKRDDEMTFGESIAICLKNYATFERRAGRAEYWWFFLFSLLMQMGASLFGRPAAGLVTLVLFLPGLAAGARRLHDIGKSGWWLLVGAVPVIGAFILLYWFVQPGMKASNAYGDAPRESVQAG